MEQDRVRCSQSENREYMEESEAMTNYLIEKGPDVLWCLVLISPNSSFMKQPPGLRTEEPDIVNIGYLSAVSRYLW